MSEPTERDREMACEWVVEHYGSGPDSSLAKVLATARNEGRQEERARCAKAASWAIHDAELPPGEHNLEIRSLINRHVLQEIEKGRDDA